MRQRYTESGQWWRNPRSPGPQDAPLPADLLDDLPADSASRIAAGA